MTKFMFVAFTALTLCAAWMTYYDVGVKDPVVSAREGSAGHMMRGTSRGYYGK